MCTGCPSACVGGSIQLALYCVYLYILLVQFFFNAGYQRLVEVMSIMLMASFQSPRYIYHHIHVYMYYVNRILPPPPHHTHTHTHTHACTNAMHIFKSCFHLARSQCKQMPGAQARNSQVLSHRKWCGHLKSHLDHCC